MNFLEIDKSKYSDSDLFWTDVANILSVLTRQGYTASFRFDDCGIYVITYDYDYRSGEGLGDKTLQWVSEDELEKIIEYRDAENT